MQIVTRIVTFDGHEHTTQEKARHHLSELKGAILTSLAHRIVGVVKYAGVLEILEEEIPKFRALIQIENDFNVEDPEEIYADRS